MAAKAAVAGLAAILVVAMVVAVAVGVTRKQSESSSINAGSTKAVQSICAPTDYIDTCEKSLSDADTTDPKELIKAAFEFTEKNIGDVIRTRLCSKKQPVMIAPSKHWRSVKKCSTQPSMISRGRSTRSVNSTPQRPMSTSRTSRRGLALLSPTMKPALMPLRTPQMSSNGLAMVSNMSSIFTSLQTGSAASRKLLSEEEADLFISKKQRSLLALQPNAVVAQDGSGQFKTISAAIASVPQKNNQMFVIHVKAGVYKESVEIPKKVNKIVLIGDGPLKTRITGRKNYAEGVKTFHTATVAVNADEFMAKDIGIENTAGPLGHQAVALRVSGDRAIFHNVHIDGYQDTLYAHTYRQYYRDCSISGTIDFIFGDAQALFQNCKFVVRKPGPNQACMVTAQGRVERHSLGATVIQNGDFVAEPALLQASPPVKVYLGRPWKMLSRTIIMQSNIGGFVAPEGWSVWQGTFALDTLYYAEYQNRGPGSDQKSRVAWKGIQHFSPQMAESWTGAKMYKGDEWIRNSGVPYVPTMMKV
ncbi:UNVERIFIED_CONTAM: putative pectinesterase/pectinesterase inhibitor 28 [Sesamum radiatum]|uniref:Pectinesterase n=1 Tax=Sesamum radiatum TaxID=300843 RepID=A0AAW2SLE7_SESRA